MLPLLRPILYLPFLKQQTKAKEEHPITIKDFNNSNNQDILHDSPLINAENTTTTNSNLDTK
jgi:hypothetical protein